MIAWIIVGVIIAVTAVAVLLLRARARSKGRAVAGLPPVQEGGNPPNDTASAEGGSQRGSASKWLSSLVKAEGDERAKRRGDRY